MVLRRYLSLSKNLPQVEPVNLLIIPSADINIIIVCSDSSGLRSGTLALPMGDHQFFDKRGCNWKREMLV